MYAPLLAKLTPEAKEKFLKSNYERIFDQARKQVRAWEKANIGKKRPPSPRPPFRVMQNDLSLFLIRPPGEGREDGDDD